MLSEWQFIAIFVVLSPIFPLMPVVVNRLLGPQRPNPIKQQTYECGIETVGDTFDALTVIFTSDEVVEAPSLSVATAVSV